MSEGKEGDLSELTHPPTHPPTYLHSRRMVARPRRRQRVWCRTKARVVEREEEEEEEEEERVV